MGPYIRYLFDTNDADLAWVGCQNVTLSSERLLMKLRQGLFSHAPKLLVASLVLAVFSTMVFATSYSREQLQQMSKEELIGIVLYLQGGTNSNCERYELDGTQASSLMVRVSHPGYSDDGSLKWPNGKTFLLRNPGYNTDRTLYYPNGQILRLEFPGNGNDHMTYWPNFKVQRVVNKGYSNDGAIFHADGSNWLIRNRGYNNDLDRVGAPTDSVSVDGFTTSARLTPDNAIVAVTTVSGDGWSIHVYATSSAVDYSKDRIFFDECFQ